jgi:hypothetical protein
MYRIHLFFDWLGQHTLWLVLGVLVVVGTVAVSLYFDRRRRVR